MATVPVISPEGQFGSIPQENLNAAVQRGFKAATSVVSPEGQDGWLPMDKVHEAIGRGFKVGTSSQLPQEEAPQSGTLDTVLREGTLGVASGAGLPESTHRMDYSALPGLANIAAHPIDSAKLVGGAIASGQQDQIDKSNAAKQAGDRFGTLVHGVAGAIPIIGPAAENAGEEIGQGLHIGEKGVPVDWGKVAHGVGSGIGQILTLGTGTEKGGRIANEAITEVGGNVAKPVAATAKRVPEMIQNVKQVLDPVKTLTAEQAATKAIRPRNSKANFPQELQTALPDARRAADTLGINPQTMTMDDALNAVTQAKKDVWGEYKNNHSDPNADVTVDTSPVADSIRQTVSKRMAEQNPGLAKKITRVADTYDGRDLSVTDLEERVQELNRQTRAIEAKYTVDKRAAKMSPNNAPIFAERDGLRQLLLDKMAENAPDFVGSNPQTSAAALRKRYGNLMSVEDSLSRRLPVANRQSPKGLTDILSDIYGPAQIAKGVAQMATGVGAIHGLANVIEGGVGMKMAKNAKLMNSPDFLIQQAFQKSKPTDAPTLRNIHEGEYISGDNGPFHTPQAASYPDQQLPSGQPRVNALPAGDYAAPPSPLDQIFRPRPPQLQKGQTVAPASRQLRAKGALPLGPSGSTGATNIEPVRLPWSNGVVAPEGQAVANAVTKGATPRQFAQPKSSGQPLPFLRPNAEATPVTPIQKSIESAGGNYIGASNGIAYFNVPKLGAKSSTLALPEMSTPEQVATHIQNALADAKARSPKASKPQANTPAPNPDDVAMASRFRLSQLQDALSKSTIPKEKAELQSTIEQIKSQLPKRNDAPLLPWQTERRGGGPTGQRFSGESNTVVTPEDYQAARKSFLNKVSGSNMGVDPTALADLAKIGAYHLERGLRGFSEWSQAMIKELGEQVRPHLQNIWQQIQSDKPNAPTFYSKAEQVANEKLPNSGSGPAMRQTLKNSGVKDDELKWSGADELLKKPSVTKQEVLNTLRENGINVQEVMKGNKNALGLSRDKWANDEFGKPYSGLSNSQKEYVDSLFDEPKIAQTKFSSYQLPGGEDYRELLLTLPQKMEPSISKPGAMAAVQNGTFRSGHFDEPNVLAHVRFNDRVDAAGKKTLFLEELQSDWHQKGRKQGYADPKRVKELEAEKQELLAGMDKSPVPKETLRLGDELRNIEQTDGAGSLRASAIRRLLYRKGYTTVYGGGLAANEFEVERRLPDRVEEINREQNAISHRGVPDAPFKKDWHELVLKRMIRYAAENGYDKMAWTPGDVQNSRYDLSKHVDSVKWIEGKDGNGILAADKGDSTVIDKQISRDELSDYIGKDAAAKLLAQSPRSLNNSTTHTVREISGPDLQVGGSGMKGFYDKIIPDFLNKYGKQWGARVGTTDIGINHGDTGKVAPVHSIDITPAMKHSVLKQGQPIAKAKSLLPWLNGAANG